ncbi:MAG: DUF4349 domain-containing protein [Solobacterium sp.]|nr:DUF4349 domain-containing protein [Solobacterium sp.]
MKRKWMTAAVLAVLLAGCGSAAGKPQYTNEEAAVGGGAYDEKYETSPAAAPDALIDPEMTADQQEKLVYRADLRVETRKYDETVAKLREAVKQYQGFFVYEYQYETGYSWKYEKQKGTMHLDVTVRIPAKDFQTFLESMDSVGRVVSRNTSADNITRQYNDTTIQIEALQKQETRLLEMMDKAETIEDMILVEKRLTEVQTDLNLLMTRKENMDTDVEYSTVTLTIDEVKEYTEVHEDFGGRLVQGFTDGWKSFLNVIEGTAVGILYLSPYILLILACVLIFRKLGIKVRLPGRKKPKDNA